MKHCLWIALVCMMSCSSSRVAESSTQSAPVAVPGKLFATIFQEKAAEYRALCYQAYNVAMWRVDQYKKESGALPPAIMTDVDETVLSNATYQAQQTLAGKDYDPESWYAWTASGTADTVPGALQFLRYAAARGFAIFYVTNRKENERAGTLANLQKFDFPFAVNEHLLLRTSEASKKARKEQIMENYEVVLFVGDNLNDMSDAFENKNVAGRFAVTDAHRQLFGEKFIVLPNAVYGDWENAIYGHKHLTAAQKDSVLRQVFKR